VAAHRKPCPYGAEELTSAITEAGGIHPLGAKIDTDPKTITRWARDFGIDLTQRPKPIDKVNALGKIAALLERSGIDPADIGKVQQFKLSEWEGLSKNADGEVVVTPLEGASIVLTPTWETGPAWPVVQPAPPLAIKAAKPRIRKTGGWKIAVGLADPQVGYRRDLATNDLDPFHDDRAMALALQVIADLQPDLIVNFGDLMDFAEMGRFEQEPGFALTTQPTIDRASSFLAEQRAAAPNAKQVLLAGNHEERLPRWIIANAKAAFGLKQANSEPAAWPVMSVPHLLRLDEIGVEFIPGFPAGVFWINERLACIHGHKVRSGGSTAAAVIADERMSVLFGHVHRLELQHRTKRVYGGSRTHLAACIGCLSRTDGAVPSVRGGMDPMGRPVPAVEDWQQGFCVVTYREGDEPFHVELVPIHDGQALFRGRHFTTDALEVAA
jgi:predicted phosphodiesterase